eukprot:1496412-Alexandrium_andersonii.AAC.1
MEPKPARCVWLSAWCAQCKWTYSSLLRSSFVAMSRRLVASAAGMPTREVEPSARLRETSRPCCAEDRSRLGVRSYAVLGTSTAAPPSAS